MQSLGRRIPWRRAWRPTPAFLPRNLTDGGAWRAAVQGVTESDTTEATQPAAPGVLGKVWLQGSAGRPVAFPSGRLGVSRSVSCVCVCVCVCVLHLYPSWTCRSFPYFGCCNNAAVNTGVHIPFQIHVFLFFRQIPESFGLAKNVIQLFFYKMLWKTLNELFG